MWRSSLTPSAGLDGGQPTNQDYLDHSDHVIYSFAFAEHGRAFGKEAEAGVDTRQ